MATKSFDPNQLTITIGSHIANGFASGTFIDVVKDDKQYETEVDANGNSYRYKINNNNVTVTLTLAQGSNTNDVLSTFMNLDIQANTGVFPIMIKDNLGSTLISSKGAYVDTAATAAMGTSGNNRVWIIKATEAGFFIGGMND